MTFVLQTDAAERRWKAGRMNAIPQDTPRVYLDTSAFSRLWGHRDFPDRALLRLRRRLASPLFDRRPVLLISATLLGEIAAAHEAAESVARLQEQIAFIRSCVFEIPLQTIECITAEIRGDRAFASTDQLETLLREVQRGGPVVDEERRFHLTIKDRFRRSEESRRAEMVRRMGGQRILGPQAAIWLDGLSAQVVEWATDTMTAEAGKWGLPRDRSRWPAPQELPTLWALIGFQLARLALLHRDGRRIDENDALDWSHFHSAAHAAQFVSEDRRLREIAEICPHPRPQVLAFRDWARQYL